MLTECVKKTTTPQKKKQNKEANVCHCISMYMRLTSFECLYLEVLLNV